MRYRVTSSRLLPSLLDQAITDQTIITIVILSIIAVVEQANHDRRLDQAIVQVKVNLTYMPIFHMVSFTPRV
ncbi:hypothetical protein EJB05_25147, partial [Eragrostis curvula]